MHEREERSRWDPVKGLMGETPSVRLGSHLTYQFMNSPRKVLYAAAYYKFAAKMVGAEARVLDVGCGEGMGTCILAAECASAHGIDLDADAIAVASSNWKKDNISFEEGDFLSRTREPFDAVVSFDVIEHILPEHTGAFMSLMMAHLKEYGIAIVGTPNITSDQYASPLTRAGHVNLFSGERLASEMAKHFKHVFMFGANDEIVHTGFLPMAHYLIAVGCLPR